MEDVTGVVFNIQKFCTDDGPGIRTTVFLKGCPLRCTWCHNPEGLSFSPIVDFRRVSCNNCGICSHVCKNNCHTFTSGTHVIDLSHCTNCFKCVDNCTSNALVSCGKQMNVAQVIKSIKADLLFYKRGNGGVTLSGGEPLMQSEFCLNILKQCKELNIHTCVETSGYVNKNVFSLINPYVDLYLYDYKESIDENHIKHTGVSHKLILENLKYLHEENKKVILRCPIIKTVNDRKEHFQEINNLSRMYNNIIDVQIMPYHALGTSKKERFLLDGVTQYELPTQKDILEWNNNIKRSNENDL